MAQHTAIKRFDLETYETLVAYNGDILFEWDLVTDRFGATPNAFDIFGYLPSGDDFSETIKNSENIHPDDKAVIEKYFETIQYNGHDLKNKKFYSRLELRIRNAYNEFTLCKIQLVAHYSAQNLPYKITGMITSIGLDKTPPEKNAQREQTDPLTGLYNRSSAMRLIKKSIQKSDGTGTCALLLIDVSEIKAIDENLGQCFGDAVLSDLSATVKLHFLESDIVGRFSDDTFIVFTANIHAISAFKERLSALSALLRRAYRTDETAYKFSARVSAALYPAHGKTLDSLLASAEKALYYAKHHDESAYALYRDNMVKAMRRQSADEPQRLWNEKKLFDANLPEYIVNILHTCKDRMAAGQMLLEVIGKKFNISRAFLCVRGSVDSPYRKTLEWRSKEADLLKPAEEETPAGLVESLFRATEQHDLHACGDLNHLTAPQIAYFKSIHTQSFLYARIVEDGVTKGYIGFDECRKERPWSAAEMDIVRFLSGVFPPFLLKHRMAQKTTAAPASSVVKLLHSLDNALYIVDRFTYDILFVNNTFNAQLGAENASGDKCHQLLYQSDHPCDNCPLSKLTPACRRFSNEFYDKKRRVWLKRTATKIEWNDSPDACLLQLHDITAQKEWEFLPMN